MNDNTTVLPNTSDACTDLLQLSARTSPTTITADSDAFLAKYSAEFANPEYCGDFISQLLAHIGMMEIVNNEPLIKLESQALIVNALFFTLSKLCQHEPLRETRASVLLQLNHHASLTLTLALKIMREKRLHLGQHLSVISKIKGSYTVLQDVLPETYTLFTLLLRNQVHDIYSEHLIKELKKQSLVFFFNNVNHALMMAEYADLLESREQARCYIQEALNFFQQMKTHEKSLRALRSKPKAEMNRLYTELAWQTSNNYKRYQSNNLNGDLCGAFYNVITSNEASNLNALAVLSDNIQRSIGTQTDLTSMAYQAIKKEIAAFKDIFSELSLPTSIPAVIKWKENINNVFKLIQIFKRCHHREEIAQLLTPMIGLFEIIVNKMSDEANHVIFKTIAEHLELVKARMVDINQQCSAMLAARNQPTAPAATVEPPIPYITIGERPLTQALDELYSDKFDPSALSHSLVLLLSDQNMTQQIIQALLKKLNQEAPPDEVLQNMDLTQIQQFLIEANRKINLLMFITEQALTKYPALKNLKIEATGALYDISTMYFAAGLRKFKADDDHTEEDKNLYIKLNEHFQTLEKLIPYYNDYIYHLKSSGLENKIWPAHLNVLKCQTDFVHICLTINLFSRAAAVFVVASKNLIEVNDAIEEIASLTGFSRHILGHELAANYGAMLESASQKIAVYEKLNKPNHIVYQLDNIFYSESPRDKVNKLFEALQNISPKMGNDNYAALIEQYHMLWKVYAFRSEMLAYIQIRCDQIIASAERCQDKPPAEKIASIGNLQMMINGLFFIIKELAPYHDRRFPTDEISHQLQKAFLIIMAQQAQLFWQLIDENRVPFGFHALYYQQLKNNYDIFTMHIFYEFTKCLENKVATEPDYFSSQAKTLFDFAIYFAAIAEQFANFEWAREAHNQADSALILQARSAELNEVYLKCKEILQQRSRMPVPAQLLLLHSQFLLLSEKVEQVDSFLENFGKKKSFHINKTDSETCQLAEVLMHRIAENTQNTIVLCEVTLQLNHDFDLPRMIAILSTIKQHLLDNQMEVESLHGITNLLAETTSLFVKHIDKSLVLLHKELKRLESIEAKKQREEVLRIQQAIQRENRKNNQRVRVAEQESIKAPAPKRQLATPIVRERQRKKQGSVELIEANELTYEMVEAEAELAKPEKLSKKAIRQQKKDKKRQALMPSPEAIVTPIVPSTDKPLASTSLAIKSSTQQTKKQRRILRNQAVEEISFDLIHELIKEVAALTLAEEKLFAQDEDHAYRVPDVYIEREPQLQKLLELLTKEKVKAYAYGGYPRDCLLNRPHKDLDLVVFCSPETIVKLFGSEARPHNTILNQFSLQGNIDIRCTNSSLLEFANALDTTANALFVNANGQLYDPKGGYINLMGPAPLESIGNTQQTFADDPIKMFRLMRQSCDLRKEIQTKDYKAIKRHAGLLASVPFKDFRKHFSSLFLNGNAASQFEWLFKKGLLNSFLPVLKSANYSYRYVPFWLQTHCKRIDANANRVNDYPFYRLIAIFLAPHCYNMAKSGPQAQADIVNNVALDFFAIFQGFKASKKEFTFLNDELNLFTNTFRIDSARQLQRLEEQYANERATPIVHQYQTKRKPIESEMEINFPDIKRLHISGRRHGVS